MFFTQHPHASSSEVINLMILPFRNCFEELACAFKIAEAEAFKQRIAFSRKNFFSLCSPLHTLDVSLVNCLLCIQLFHICMAF